MKLTPDQAKQCLSWLSEHWKGDNQCPICKSDKWTVNDTIFEIRSFANGTLFVGGPVFPAVSVICDSCGYSLFFNAIKVGLVLADTPETPKKKEGNDAS